MEYIEKEKIYKKISKLSEDLTSFLASSNLKKEEYQKLNNITNEALKLKFEIFDTPSAKVIEIPYQLGQKYYVRAITCSYGGYEKKGKFFPGEWDCEGCCEKCDKEFVVSEKTFRSVDEMSWMKDYEGKNFWLRPEDVPI